MEYFIKQNFKEFSHLILLSNMVKITGTLHIQSRGKPWMRFGWKYHSNLYWWGKGWPVDGLPFPDTGCPVPDVSIYYMSNINELPDGILFHWFCKCTPPWMFLPLDIPSEYRPEHVTFGLLCVIFKFPSRIFCRRVPGFATDCPCGVWCRGLTTCLLYVGPPLEF